MASRREFTFGSMILALTGARAASAAPAPELDAAPDVVPREPKLGLAFALSRSGQELHVALSVTNRHSDPVDIVAKRGSMPGAYVEAAVEIDGRRFELPVVFEGDRREIFSRAGPMPRYEHLEPGATLAMGTYRYQWPKGVPDLPVKLDGGVDVDTFHVEFHRTERIAARGPRS